MPQLNGEFSLPSVPAKGLLRKKESLGSKPLATQEDIFSHDLVLLRNLEHCLALLHVYHQKVLPEGTHKPSCAHSLTLQSHLTEGVLIPLSN